MQDDSFDFFSGRPEEEFLEKPPISYDDPLMDPRLCFAPADQDVIMAGPSPEPAEDISFIGQEADIESEVVKQQHPRESFFDDDVTSALLNGINNKSANLSQILEYCGDSIQASDGSKSMQQ